MKRSFIYLVFSFFPLIAISQNTHFPNGVYLSTQQLKNKKPEYDIDFKIYRLTKNDKFWTSPNDYKISSPRDSITKKYINKKIFAYVKNDSLFINCFPHKIWSGYALSMNQGTYLVFLGAAPEDEFSGYSIAGGAVGGAILGVVEAASIANKRYLYVLSLRTGNVRFLTKEYLVERLKGSQTLLDQFNIEKEKNSKTTLLKYINLLNEIVPLDSEPPVESENTTHNKK